jgi:hypothetical protein
MAFLEHVLAGLTTSALITAAHKQGSLVLLFAKEAKHHQIHWHNAEKHPRHFTKCTEGACSGSNATQSSLVAATE